MPDEPTPEALHEQREWLRVTLASIGDAVITTDMSGCVTFLNSVGESLTGWTREEATGVPLDIVFQIVNEETRHTVENPATRALREGLVVGLANHTLLIAKNGVERPIDDSAAPIRNAAGEVAGVVLVFRDVTERREAERALKLSEERFRLLVEGVKDYAIFMLDPQGNVVSWNSGAERIKRYQRDEIVGKHFSCFYPQEAIESGWPEKELAIAREEGRLENDGWRIRKDGSKFWANVIITALRDDAGNLRGYAKVTRDLTQRRQLERATLQAEALAELDRRKDEFLAMLSHELRNPLLPILNAAHLLHLQKSDNPVQNQAIAIIERQLKQLTRLIDDLLEVSRITTGRVRLQQEHIDARTIAQRAVEAVRPTIAQRRQELSVSLPSAPIWLNADPTRIEQVVVNLLTNAVKFSNEGGSIWVNLQQDGEEAVLSVRDQGVGVDPSLLPRIFDLFTQGDRSLDRSQGGLGVGLTVVRRVAEMHGGRVEAHSLGLGQGSEFIVRLPVVAPPTSEPSSTAPLAAAQAASRLRVLVVDDNKDTADSAALLLRHSGHDVQVAYTGNTAVEAAFSYQPHVVFLDIGLPEGDGYEVARRIRQNPNVKSARLIAVTGYGQESDRKRSQEAGFDDHLVKPIDPQKIQEILASLSK